MHVHTHMTLLGSPSPPLP